MPSEFPRRRAASVTANDTSDFTDASSGVRARRLLPGARVVNLGRWAALALMLTAGALGIFTFLAYTAENRFGLDVDEFQILLVVDVVVLLGLGATVVWAVVRLYSQRRAGAAGARLHVRIAALFSLVAVAPAIIVAVLAALFFNVEVQSWFNERVRAAVDNSVVVAEAYLREHKQVIEADALAMAHDLNRVWGSFVVDPLRVRETVQVQAVLRSLPEAMVFDGSGRVLARAGLTSSLEFNPPPFWALDRASKGEVVILAGNTDDRVRALVGLDTVPEAFLYVGRFIDPNVLRAVELTQRAASEYAETEEARSSLQLQLALIFAIVTLLLLMTAVGLGLGFANRLTRPIARLVHATEMVRAGNLSVRVDEHSHSQDEIGVLSRAFNRMARQLEEQRRELTEANRQLDDRRRFTEAVLAGVSAGVLGLDRKGRVNLPNRSATALLDLRLDGIMGRPLAETVPEMAPLIERAVADPERHIEDEVNVETGRGHRTLHVRIAAERDAQDQVIGFVVTFDDVTELLSAQRKAAWADVARRIAHEIKNPLTPIQLSAERLKRKYLRQITSDPDTFAQCTDTIVRQVGDIGRMVDEFSAFARMPNPVMKDEDFAAICRDAVFLQRQAHPEIEFAIDIPQAPVPVHGDSRLLHQALTNLLQNAVDAITGSVDRTSGRIWVALRVAPNVAALSVEDDGRGLPEDARDRLTEPYVTTREKGTGLGLAIVARIMEQHAGRLSLDDRYEHAPGSRVRVRAPGASVTLTLPLCGIDPAGGGESRANQGVGRA